MSTSLLPVLSRRTALAGGGALVLSFSMMRSVLAQDSPGPQESKGAADVKAPPLPGSLKQTPMLDAWISIGGDGSITIFTGKCELGQGAKTALLQIAAEQLMVDPGAITLVTADTARTPNEGFTAGSHTMQDSGTAILNAAAQVREKLIDLAASRLNVSRDTLHAENGAVISGNGQRTAYRDLVQGLDLHVRAEPHSVLVDPAKHRFMGKPVQRVDIPAKVTGGQAYVQDMRPDGMVHGRIVRPPIYGAKLTNIDTSAVEKMPGVLKVVRDGSWLAVVATKEWQAIKAARALAAAAHWDESANLPPMDQVFDKLKSANHVDRVPLDRPGPEPRVAKRIHAEFRRDYQMHVSIGPSCAVALFDNDKLTVWSHAQGMFPLRQAIAQMLSLQDDQVDCIHAEGAGCYGHNGADDAAADAALLAHAYPGKPVRVQWMRADENVWEPKGSAMIVEADAALDDAGMIVDWNYQVWSNTHSTRPPGAGQLMPAWFLEKAFQPDPPQPIPLPEGDGDRNSQPLYAFPKVHVVYHFVPETVLRVSALRGLGAYMNIFSLESLMDELAQAAGTDPVAFRLKHLQDDRAKEVINRAAQEFGWKPDRQRVPHVGHGFAFARYKNLGAYAAVAVEVSVDPEIGRVTLHRFDAAVDSGEAINPDGIRNQIEGGIVQSSSWTLVEQVDYDAHRILARDWSTYPILRFHSVPENVRVHVIDRPGMPFLGTGEATQGPTAAAIANAVADAIGTRLRHLPLTAERIRTAIAATSAARAGTAAPT